MKPQELLRLHPFFSSLTERDTQRLIMRTRIKRVPAGRVIFRKDEPGDGLYGVLAGRMAFTVDSSEGKELTLNVLGPGEFFGEIALLDGKGRSATAIAYEESRLVHVSRDSLLVFLRARPEAMLRIIAFVCARLRRVTTLMEDSTFLNVPARLAKQIMALIDDAPGQRTSATLRISQTDLARMLGVSREFVGKQLVIWREAGIVELGRRRLTVRDTRALEQLAVG